VRKTGLRTCPAAALCMAAAQPAGRYTGRRASGYAPNRLLTTTFGRPPRTAGRRAFFLTFSITQRDPPFDVTRAARLVLRSWWARCLSMLRASSAAVAARSRRTRRALCGIMWVIFDHLRPSGHIMPDHAGDREAQWPWLWCLTITSISARSGRRGLSRALHKHANGLGRLSPRPEPRPPWNLMDAESPYLVKPANVRTEAQAGAPGPGPGSLGAAPA